MKDLQKRLQRSWFIYRGLTLILVAMSIFFPLIIAGRTFEKHILTPLYYNVIHSISSMNLQLASLPSVTLLQHTLINLKTESDLIINITTILIAIIVACLLYYVLIAMRISQGNRALIDLVADLEHAGLKQIMKPRSLASFKYDTSGYLADILLRFQTSVAKFSEKLTSEIESSAKIKNELNIAHQLQKSILPTNFSDIEKTNPNILIHADLQPAGEIAGDFYDFFTLGDHHIFFLIGDVCGKSIPACLSMFRAITLFRALAERHYELYKDNTSIATLFEVINNNIAKDNTMHVYTTAIAGIINTDSGFIKYANAGHNLPILIQQNKIHFIKPKKYFRPLGIRNNIAYEDYYIQLKKHETFFLYTDGLTEARSKQGKEFGVK